MDGADQLIASVQAIIQQNLAEKRNLTRVEIDKLCDYAWQLAALTEDCFDDYKAQFYYLLDEARTKATDQKARTYYYALMVEFRLRQHSQSTIQTKFQKTD